MNTPGWVTLVLTSIPPLAGVAAKIYLGSSDGRIVRKIEKDIALHDIAPERSKEVLEQLIYAETITHAQRRLNTAVRKVNWPVAFWIFVGVVVTGFAGWGLAYAAVTYWWPIWIPCALVGFFGVLWIIAGAGQLFKYPADEDDSEAAGDAASGG